MCGDCIDCCDKKILRRLKEKFLYISITNFQFLYGWTVDSISISSAYYYYSYVCDREYVFFYFSLRLNIFLIFLQRSSTKNLFMSFVG